MPDQLDRRLLAASAALRSLTVGADFEAHAAIEALYAAVRDAEAGLARRSSALSALAAAILAHLDRVRSHRLALTPPVVEQLSRALVLFQAPNASSAPVENEALSLAASLTPAGDSLAPGDDDWHVFVEDSQQQLDACENELRALVGEPADDAPVVQRVFRALHTFKGNCGLVGAAQLELLARAGEDVLSGLRSGELASTAELRGALLRLLGRLRSGLSTPADDGDDERLALVQAAERARRVATETRLGDLLVAKQLVDPIDVQAALAWKARPLGEVLVELRALSPDALEHALGEQKRLRDGGLPAPRPSGARAHSAPRQPPLVVDRVNELVSAAEALVDCIDRTVPDLAQRQLGALVTQLREAIQRVGLVSISNAFRRAELATSSLTQAQGKQVRLTLEGGDLEVSHATLDIVSTVILHAVRNAIDHGIESPAERASSGKPEQGALRVACTETPDGLALTVTDDGRGLNREAILTRAKAMGVSLQADSDEAIFELVFLPGFSTSATLTESSGRGVGMDAVRAKVESNGGTVRIASARGGGTSLLVALPSVVSRRAEAIEGDSAKTSGTYKTRNYGKTRTI
ncbi:MAG TPA: ATP-binding protein [Polyangiaceae bacterium]|nr:ATP-binding protein [Polyangiaceae bacterium]